jgi:penicillin-insensitive murein DD-endopeptidase
VRGLTLGILGAVLSLTSPDAAAPARHADREEAPGHRADREEAPARSIGSPNEGRLAGGIRLPEAPYLRVVPYYAESHARWGLPALIGLIERAGRRVARHYPGSVLGVGDLSRRGGGELDRHHSHESGRDADLGFYIRTATNKPLLVDRFLAFTSTGTSSSLPGAVFDDARNWALIEALIEDSEARVTHVFVAPAIRARLLRFAEQSGVSLAVRQRAAEVMSQPRRVPAHDDHFHIRIACPQDQHGTCVEQVRVYSAHVRPPVARPRQRATDRRGLPSLSRAEPMSSTVPDFEPTLATELAQGTR